MKISLDNNIKVGVAVSGGVDSMVLLHLLMKNKNQIIVINIEHGIRGRESVNDSEFVIKYCKDNNIDCLNHTVDAVQHAKQTGISIELAARQLRYQIFESLLQKGSLDTIALGHHADDQIETILMRLFRGTGVRGLRGIVDRKGYIHPLLMYDKNEIVAYAKRHNIPFVEDKTNKDTIYSRNYIRQQVIPIIKYKYPNIADSVCTMSKNLSEVEDYLLSEITPSEKISGGRSLQVSTLNRHPAIAKKSIVECLRTMGVEKDIEYTHLESIYNLKDCINNAVINLPFGIDAIKEYDNILFIKRQNDTAVFMDAFDIKKSYSFAGKSYSFYPYDKIATQTFDIDKLPDGTMIRTRQNGDRFKRYGGGTKLLSDYLADIKVPLRLRDSLLVLAKGNIVYAILGIEISEHIKIDSTTKAIYRIHSTDVPDY